MSVRRILLSRLDRVGDLILSTPAIATLRRAFPDAHVTIACSAYNAVVVQHSPDVDAVATLPAGLTPHRFGTEFRGADLAIAVTGIAGPGSRFTSGIKSDAAT